MKKIYSSLSLALLFVVILNSNAQAPYHKMIAPNTTDWYIFQDYIPVKPAAGSAVNSIYLQEGKYSATTNTVVLGNTYKRMSHVYFSPGFPQNLLIGFIREDTIARKVYFLEKNTTSEVTLYDFSLTQGSVTNLNFPDSFGDFPAGSYTVTTADSTMTRVGYRKRLKLIGPSTDTLIHIESIGSIIHPLYLYQSYYGPGQFSFGWSSTCSYPYGLGLACKESDNQKFFQSCTYDLALMSSCIYEYDSCNYYNSCSGIKESISNIKHRIMPNPATDMVNLEIDLDNEALINVDLYDVYGRKIKTLYMGKILNDNKTISLNISSFENGYYFLKIYNKDFSINHPLVISK